MKNAKVKNRELGLTKQREVVLQVIRDTPRTAAVVRSHIAAVLAPDGV